MTKLFNWGRRAGDLDPLNAESWESLREIEFFMGQLVEAAADSKKALELSPDVFSLLSQTTRLVGKRSRTPQVYAIRNQSDNAFEWLDRANAQRDSGLIGTKVDPLLKTTTRDFLRS